MRCLGREGFFIRHKKAENMGEQKNSDRAEIFAKLQHDSVAFFEYVDDHRSGKIVVQLNGRLNKVGVISPRFNIRINDIEKWVTNLLPSRQFGYIILTTSAGIMDHEEARRKHVAGKILGFVY